MFDYQRVLPKVVYGMNEHLNTKNSGKASFIYGIYDSFFWMLGGLSTKHGCLMWFNVRDLATKKQGLYNGVPDSARPAPGRKF